MEFTGCLANVVEFRVPAKPGQRTFFFCTAEPGYVAVQASKETQPILLEPGYGLMQVTKRTLSSTVYSVPGLTQAAAAQTRGHRDA